LYIYLIQAIASVIDACDDFGSYMSDAVTE
jgi:hypothetical protein